MRSHVVPYRPTPNLTQQNSAHDTVGCMTKYWAVTCKNKDCEKPILDTVYAGHGVVNYRISDPIRCPNCGQEGKYGGEDFHVIEGPDPS